MRRLIFPFALLALASTVLATDNVPKVIDSRICVGPNCTSNNGLFTLVGTGQTARLALFQVRPTASSSNPFITMSQRTTSDGSDVAAFAFNIDSAGALNVRNTVASTTPLSISSAGVTTISSAVLTAATFPSASALASPTLSGTISVTGNEVFSGATGIGTQGNTTLFSLTDGAAAATFVKVTVASNSYISGQIIFSVEANDATNFQVRGGIAEFAAVNKAGTITCGVSTQTSAVEALGSSSGTLTNTFTCADAGSGVMNLLDAADTSLTVGAGFVRLRYRINVTGTATVTPQ